MAAYKKSFMNQLAAAQREADKKRVRDQNAAYKQLERRQLEEQRAQEKLAKINAQAAKQREREQAKRDKEMEKERARIYTESRLAEVELRNAELEAKIGELEAILHATLSVDDYIDLSTLKQKPDITPFTLPNYLIRENPRPVLERYLPAEPTGLQKLIPGTKAKYQKSVDQARMHYSLDLEKHDAKEQSRKKEIERLQKEHEDRTTAHIKRVEEHNTEIEEFKNRLEMGDSEAIINYCTLVLESSIYPDDFPQRAKVAYVPESKQVVIEYDLPTIDIVPDLGSYKYVKTKDEITSSARPMTQRKSLYSSVVAQITLRTIHEMFEADRWKHIETIIFNGYVESINKGTGRDTRTCVITVRTSREQFLELELSRVDPQECLKALNASVSKSPSELAPVRPVLEFSMVDSRFIEETDVISTLDQRPNLLDLSPGEFESLITNLFQKMGLESRQTQASRDGGVDCVAYDPRPIFGGKVIIQAKRYKGTVGVSAVRDLYGTLQNEGASKGILVTTSGYGKAAFEFADGKPLELLSGSNLLYLLKEYADIDAKIEVPATWKDPAFDVEDIP